MKVIDRYIVRKFLSAFFFVVVMLLMITVIIDLSQKLGGFLENGLGFGAVVHYYLHFALFYGSLFMPMGLFVSVIFFTSKMASNSEIIAILSSGIRFGRLLLPFLGSATLLALLALYSNHFVLPISNRFRNRFEYRYLSSQYARSKTLERDNLARKISPHEYIFFSEFNDKTNVGYDFVYERLAGDTLKVRMTSSSLVYDKRDTAKPYELRNYRLRITHPGGDFLKSGTALDTSFNFLPSDILVKSYEAETLTYLQLKRFIEEERARGSDRLYIHQLEMYRRTAMPMSSYVLTVIAVALSMRKKRGGTGINMGLGVALAFIYIFLMQVSDAFVIGGTVGPLVASWIPNAIFGSVALSLYFYAKR